MRSDYTFIAFATETPTRYADYLHRLQENCREFDIPLASEIIPNPVNESGYQKRRPGDIGLSFKDDVCRYKPVFIRKKLKELKKPVIYLDCDSLFFDGFNMPQFDFDIGIVKRTSGSMGVSDIVAGCIAFNTTQAAWAFLECWHWLCDFRGLCPTGDHRRFLATRVLMTKRKPLYKEQDLTPVLTDKLIFNPGKKRESRC